MINVTIDNKIFTLQKKTSVIEILNKIEDGTFEGVNTHLEGDIILCKINNKLCELHKVINKDCTLEFITTKSFIGNECYRRSLTFMMVKAFYKVIGKSKDLKVEVMNSLGDGYYIEVKSRKDNSLVEVDENTVEKIKNKMRDYNKRDVLITKRNMAIDEAKKMFDEYHMVSKEELLKYRVSSSINIYNMSGFEDYYYGYLAPSTGILKYFDLIKYKKGLVLLFPTMTNPTKINKLDIDDKLYDVFDVAHKWAYIIGGNTISMINDKVVSNNITELILVQEALQEKNIAQIADKIKSSKDVKFVMIAGPSSSGKTSFSYRLSVQLKALGINPHPISMDDYFVNRIDNPVDENGNLDFESVDAVDTKLFNEDMLKLKNGEEIEVPHFDFMTGTREYRGKKLKLEGNDIVIVEGIHCLNEKVSYSLNNNEKFRIYVSALTPLNIDEHNRIATSDLRLLRRMVRDARTRGSDARETIKRWEKVRKGEEKNIFPYQKNADIIFNSALLYELGVLKTYVLPLLLSVDENSKEFDEANRLLKFINYVVGIPDKYIPNNSILKEFIGGSIFPV